MALPKFIRDSVFDLAREDLAAFLEEHEDDLLVIFREEIHAIDEAIPEERAFIDIKMVPLGEVILQAALKSIIRFLREEPSEPTHRIQVRDEEPELSLDA